jgi:ABC-type transport system involved in multi-copper enzyme maturation permease subunit
MIKAIYLEELKDSIKTKKIFFVIAISLFIVFMIYASGFLQIVYLLLFKPQNTVAFPIVITYYLLYITVPIFALLLGHDAISSEIENKTIRGAISKISRHSFIIGKSLAIFTFISIINFLMLFGSAVYTNLKIQQLDLLHPLIFFLYLTLYTAAFTAIAVFFSSIFSKSSTSLFVTIISYLVFIYINMEEFFSVFSIFNYINDIISLVDLISPIAIFIIYLGVFFSATLIIFKVRDL